MSREQQIWNEAFKKFTENLCEKCKKPSKSKCLNSRKHYDNLTCSAFKSKAK